MDKHSHPGAAEPHAPETVRLGVLRPQEQDLYATITFTKGNEPFWNATISGRTLEEISEIRDLISDQSSQAQGAHEEPSGADPDSPTRSIARITQILTESGFNVVELPSADHAIRIEFNVLTGFSLAAHETLNPYASDEGTADRLVNTLTAAFEQANSGLAKQIDVLIASGRIDSAIEALRSAHQSGALYLPGGGDLLTAALRIDPLRLSPDDALFLRQFRMQLAAKQGNWETASREANAILGASGSTWSAAERADIEMVLAVAAFNTNNKETGFIITRRILERPEMLAPETRAWAWRNLSLALPKGDPESLRASQYSSDAFLEAGNKTEAARSLARVVECLYYEKPAAAIAQLDAILRMVEPTSLQQRAFRSAVLRQRSQKLAELGMHAQAFADAKDAAALIAGIAGAEADRVASLHLAALEAEKVGAQTEAGALVSEAEAIGGRIATPRFRLGRRLLNLLHAFDAQSYEDLLSEAKSVNDLDIVAGLFIARATLDPTLTGEERVSDLEETLQWEKGNHFSDDAMVPTQNALAEQLNKIGHPDRAEVWYRQIIAQNPVDIDAAMRLVQNLWNQKKWIAAADVVRRQIEIRGEKPGLLFAYGKSLHNAKQFSEAATALQKAAVLAGERDSVRSMAIALRDKALESGGVISFESIETDEVSQPLRVTDLEAALQAFSQYVSSDSRMAFWQRHGDDHRWAARPEKLAQQLLHAFLTGRFGKRSLILQEVASGYGRVDLFIQVKGGLALIIEIKMCGYKYSSSYARHGHAQILDYMNSRDTHLGFLLVFDSRLKHCGRALLGHGGNQATVSEIFVDVRPRGAKDHRCSSRASRKQRKAT